MKLFNKVLAVLVSMNFLFSSIAFGTGTSKLEPVYLANVVRYMPTTEKVKLEQVNKHCATSLDMSLADNFLECYALLKNVENNKKSTVNSYENYELIHRAFSFNGKLHVLTKNVTELDYFENNFSDFKCLVKPVNFFCDGREISKYVVFLPRSRALSTEIVQKHKDLNPNDLLLNLEKFEIWLFESGYILPENRDIYDGKSVICMREFFSLDKPAIIKDSEKYNSLKRELLADLYYLPPEFNPYDFAVHAFDIVKYSQNPDEVALPRYDMVNKVTWYINLRLADLATDYKCLLDTLAGYAERYQFINSNWNNKYSEIRSLISDMGPLTFEPNYTLANLPGGHTQCEHIRNLLTQADKRLLPPTRSGFFDRLLPDELNGLYNLLCDNDYYWLVPGKDFASFRTAFERLARYETPEGRILPGEPLTCFPKFDIQYLLESFLDKLYSDAEKSEFKKYDLYSGAVRACACLHNRMTIAQTVDTLCCNFYTIFSADKLKSTVYLLLKADCPIDKLEKIEEVIIKTIKRRDRQVAKKIFKDAKNRTGDFEGVEPWPKKNITWSSGVSSVKKSETKFKQVETSDFEGVEPWSKKNITWSSGVSSVKKSETKFKQVETSTNSGRLLQNSDIRNSSTGLFQNITKVILGTASLCFVGNLAYNNDVEKYKNTSKTKNIPKHKNNKNINKKILRNNNS